MRFFSKSSNYLLVIRPSLPGNIFAGKLPEQGISVRFSDGVADVPEETLIEAMLKHPAFNRDFTSSDAALNNDPYRATRRESEPVHVITEMQFGQATGRIKSEPKVTFSPEIESYINKIVASRTQEQVKEILSGLINKASQPGPSTPVKTDELPKTVGTTDSSQTATQFPTEPDIEIPEPISPLSYEESTKIKDDFAEDGEEIEEPQIAQKRRGRPAKGMVA